jgi:[ribosomal protein S5]-alanine N-acetyltransferase
MDGGYAANVNSIHSYAFGDLADMSPGMNIQLRNFEPEDAVMVAQLVGDEAVSKWTANIPFPYSEQDAIEWITSTRSDTFRKPYAVVWDGRLVACVSYWPCEPAGVEVGYWVGKDFWNRGICTSALKLLLTSEYFPARTDVFAKVMSQNFGSQRVLEKCGFSFLKGGSVTKGGKEIEAKFYVRRAATY